MTGGDAGTRSSSAGLRRVQLTRQEACSVGYTSAVLRSSIYLALATTSSAMSRPRRTCCARGATPRQQGFSGLEAEALFGEAVVTPSPSEANRTIILSALRTAIAIASESGAKPLLQKAEAMLNGMLAEGDQAT